MEIVNKAKYQGVLMLGCLVIVGSFYYYTILKLSINFPFYDDYESILKFLVTNETTSNGYEKFSLLFAQHNEHRIVFDRLVAFVEYCLTKKIDFITLNFIGNLALLAIVVLFYKGLSNKKNKNLLIIPVIFLVFNYRYYQISFWAMASLQNLWVLVFAFASLYFLFQSHVKLYIPVLLAIIASFTSGNGMITFIAGIIVLILLTGITRKLLVWTIMAIITILFYFYHYKKPPNHPPIVDELIQHPTHYFQYLFSFLGTGVSFDPLVAKVTGSILLALAFLFLIKKYFRKNPVLFSYLIFIILTAIAASLSRFGFGINQALDSRYAINGLLLSTCCYLIVIEMGESKWNIVLGVFFTAVTAFSHIRSYQEFVPAIAQKKSNYLKKDAFRNQGRFVMLDYGWPYSEKDIPKMWLSGADSLHIFDCHIPEISLDTVPVFTENKKIEYKIESIDTIDHKLKIRGYALIRSIDSDLITTVISVYSGTNLIKQVFSDPHSLYEMRNIYPKDHVSYEYCGFTIFSSLKGLPVGTYDLYLTLTDGKHQITTKTESSFTIL
ncbi:MAG TPA: hypothetical protein VNB90_10005 [Cytophagaceae bacterium]|jgi:hypothetical protein|nr:hypothetical protein [Cytophagaceae bacterium]